MNSNNNNANNQNNSNSQNNSGNTNKPLSAYEKAIEGRNIHMNYFKSWVNLFAIFNGALFAGYCSLIKEYKTENLVLSMTVLVLGAISAWFWYFSMLGFAKWNLSWLYLVKMYEKEELGDKKVYRAFIYPKSEKDKKFVKRPFSTQTLARFFVICIAIAWSIITIYETVKNFTIANCILTKIFIVLLPFIALILLIVVAVSTGRESDLSESHYLYEASGKDNFKEIQ